MIGKNLWCWFVVLAAVLSLPHVNASAQQSATALDSKGRDEGLTPDDVKAIKATIEAYRTAWLEGNASGVLKTFTDDAILLPHHGDQPVPGIAAIEKYWFAAGGPRTTITELRISVEHVSGDRNMAFACGLDTVSWTATRDGQAQLFSNSGCKFLWAPSTRTHRRERTAIAHGSPGTHAERQVIHDESRREARWVF